MGSDFLDFLVFIFFLFISRCCADDCKIGEIDLSPLQRVPWIVKTDTNASGQATDYKINICGEVPGSSCPAGTSVCRTRGQQAVSIGNLTSSLVYHETPTRREVVVNLTGSPCAEVPGENLKTFIILKCGKTLGSPVFLDSHLCDTYFEWHTTAACKDDHSEIQEPCYIYDANGQKHDLSPLIKLKGGHQVNKASRTYDFYINICRDITPDESTQGCSGSSSCYIVDGKAYGMGRPRDGLKITADGELMLHYTSEETPAICTHPPSTTINFICPKRGGGKDPELISDADCNYRVNWVTEAACHEDFLTSKSCKLSKEQHDVDFDLTPLKHIPTRPYHVNSTQEGTVYDYYLNVCGDSMAVQCPNQTSFTDNTLGCQAVHGLPNTAHVIGRKTHQELRYWDNQLTLTYRGGDPCSNGFQREMIITFTCNKTAGPGSPVFNTESEEKCTYLFDWETEYACLDHPTQCRADFGSKRFDLSVLIRETGNNWEAVRAGHSDEQDEAQYFINICNDVLRQGEAAQCPEHSAVCMIPKDGSAQNLGSYVQNPVYQSNHIVLNYTGGDDCASGGKKHSIITFICRPGDLQSAPTLIRKSADLCFYEFEWQTAAACALGRKLGTDCKVYDDDAGFSFDLNRLKLTGEKAFYNVSHDHHDYFINVCSPVTGTKCNQGQHANAGVCQQERGDSNNSRYWNLGEPSTSLSYYDGLINLTYSNGDNYNSHPPRPRVTEIAFLCDLDAGRGSPVWVQETNRSYVFEWKTKYACPDVPIECVATDEVTGKQYDLSSLAKSENGGNWVTADKKNDSLTYNFYINLCRPLNPVNVESGCDPTAAVCMTTITNRQEKVSISNMGEAKTSPRVSQTDEGPDILIEYLNGGQCTLSNGTLTQYSTRIHFICKKGDLTSGPSSYQVDSCTYVFRWETEAACDIKDTEGGNGEPCTVKDPNSEYVFNLQPLRKTGGEVYLVHDAVNNQNYMVNICGNLSTQVTSCRGAAACQVSSDNSTGNRLGPYYTNSTQLEYSDDGQLKLTYYGDRDVSTGMRTTTEITFTCDKTVPLGAPVFSKQEGHKYIFTFHTSLACPPEPVECSVYDHYGNMYDLNPLSKTTGNWQAIDTKEGDTNSVYYINVCRPINMVAGSSCPGGPVGGCVVKSTGSFNMGYIQSKPVVAADGTVTVRYIGGALCHRGKENQNHRSTRIIFSCAEKEHGPVFYHKIDCEYFFTWDTPAACPVRREIGASCAVRDPVYHYPYNLNGLRNTTTPYNVSADGSWFLLNVCDDIKKGSANCDPGRHVGSCQVEKVLSGVPGSWRNNWEAVRAGHSDEQDEAQYFINICNDVLRQGEAAQCPEHSAVCMITKAGSAQNLGSYVQNPVYQSNHIVLNYTGGDDCASGGKKHSIITFICRPGVYGTCKLCDLQSAPTLIRKSADLCFYEFEWQTAAACALGRKLGTDCKVYDDDAGFSFDLNRLKLTGEKAFYNVSHDHHDYFINVCSPVTGTKCNQGQHANAGVCQQERGSSNNRYWNLGEPSTSLSYYDGLINLTYTNGDNYNSHPPRPRVTEIAFLCDLDAGRGSPVWVQETNRSYVFEWKTKYACPDVPIECVATDEVTGKQYDLSSLAKSENGGNWVTADKKNDSLTYNFYLNLCRPLNPVNVESGCDPTAAVCMTTITNRQEKVSISNMGEAKTSPRVSQTDEGPDILIEYLNGGQCTLSNGTLTQYSTRIHFICKKGDLTSGPSSYQVDSCTYVFRWETEAACDIKDTEGGNGEPCTVKDPNSEYVFNLQPLRKTVGEVYLVHDAVNNQNYMVNICGNLSTQVTSCRGAAACQVSSDNSTGNRLGPYYTNSTQLEYSDDGQLKLTYYGDRDVSTGMRTTTEITFTCDKTVPLGVPVFSKQEGHKYIFTFHTSLACPPEPVECSVYDHYGNMYDLNPLSKTTGNWQAIDTEEGDTNGVYYINVCRPINMVSGSSCPGGPVGGCVVKSTGSFNMGYIQSKPVVAADGTVMVRYIGGALCHLGKENQNHRSTRIIFSCAEKEHGPVFSDKSDCEYFFTWDTPAACPVRREIGASCAVRDPVYHYPYNLNGLRNTTTPYNVSADGSWFLLNVCDDIKKGSANCDPGRHVGSCQVEKVLSGVPGSWSAGIANGNLTYEDGIMSLKYTGGDGGCRGNHTRSTLIRFQCDHSTSGVTKGPMFIERTDDCMYVFEWRTSYACALFKVVECIYRDAQNNQYDLSSLTLARGNYNVTDSASPRKKFIINVCSTVVHEKNVMCPHKSAACLINLDERNYTKRFHDLGEVTDQPFSMVNNRLTLTYTNGEPCAMGSGNSKTIITFECDHAAIDTNPVYTLTENCDYHFMWRTSAACPVNHGGDTTRNNCTAVNPVTGYTFDLKSLAKDTGYSVRDASGQRMDINICAPVKNAPVGCGDNSGACQTVVTNERHSYNSGIANARLQYDDGSLMLNYSGGDKCPNTGLSRNTIITFVCGAQGSGTGTPQYIDDVDGCTFYIVWHTELACETQVHCAVDTAQGTIDLSPLIMTSGHHLAMNTAPDSKDPGATFYINICRPLNPIQGTLCPAGASACRVKTGDSPLGLGKSRAPPSVDTSSGKVTLIYDHGDKCSSNPAKNISSRVIFECQQGSQQGQPYLEDVTDCEYVFVWRTNIICPEATPVVHDQCTFYDSKTRHTFDLTSLRKTSSDPQGYYQVSDYKLNVCGPLYGVSSSCNSAGVCKSDSVVFGSAASSTITYEGGMLKLTYTDGGTCASSGPGKASSQIIFECDRTAGASQPTLLTQSACDVAFTWKTPLACPPVTEECFLSHGGNLYDLRLLSRETGSWKVEDADGNMYWINVCQGIHSGHEQCPSDAAVCIKQKDGTVNSLGSVITQQLTMEGDDNVLVLKYTAGGNACGHGNPSASTVIKFECSNTVGGPVFIPSQDQTGKCEFNFLWKTSIACKEEVESLKNENGILQDPKTQGVIDLRNISQKYHYADELRGSDHYRYLIDLGSGEAVSDVPECKGAAICQTKVGAQFYRHLGTMNSSKFYLEDNVLEMIMESPSACGKDNTKTVRTIIDFYCTEEWGEPAFDFESHSCEYLFDWGTPAACVQFDIHNPSPVPHDHDSGSGGHTGPTQGGPPSASTIAAIISTFMGVILLCLLVIYFHKEERRESVYNVLEMIMESPSACGKDNTKTVRTIIDFYCTEEWGEPAFDFESHSCEYLFDWGTPAACVQFDIHNPSPVPHDHDSGSGGHTGPTQGGPPSASTIAAIISTFMGVILLCLLVIYFHKEERRNSFKTRVKICFGRSSVPNYQYSVLNQGDDDLFEELVRDISEAGEEEVNIMRSASRKKKYDEELLTDPSIVQTSFHDDSDDEILT
ncbi:cation-independent mannose-6-phosphate receptor [Lingula anatina]|uniref:Cation-independent mannose-6-phosphate receptor n=1 Tax=Lingula anatina TaxID=7574 RepID=A0A1S3K5B7_LINAN|nr:cation-independent mannose-6-phosphate receptor [Lingula anatina]|eukprot:XP_013417456.1 cation-independent mannose-6-phosphate receptor [Lingula anatina]